MENEVLAVTEIEEMEAFWSVQQESQQIEYLEYKAWLDEVMAQIGEEDQSGGY